MQLVISALFMGAIVLLGPNDTVRAVLPCGKPSVPVVTLKGHEIVSTNCTVEADRIIIPKGSVIRVEEGATLVLKAKTLEVRGPVFLNGRGQSGEDGSKGSTPPQWTSGSVCGWNIGPVGQRRQGHDDWVSSGNHANDHGFDGGNGTDGRPGARIIIFYTKLTGVTGGVSNLTFDTSGGEGGRRGIGGEGRELCCGCDPGECKRGPRGHDGNPGRTGSAGHWAINGQQGPHSIDTP